jgi:hypothetical protein
VQLSQDPEDSSGDPRPLPQGAHPDLVRRLTPQLRLTQAGLVTAVLALATGVAALASLPDLAASPSGSGWALATTSAAVVMLMICAFQHLAWRRALAEWAGTTESDLGTVRRSSWVAHLVSYVVVLFGLWSGIAGSIAAGPSTRAAALLAFTLLFLLAAQALAGVNVVRTEGDPGTVPGHLRRLNARIQRLR